jgi:hypothetical protein
VLKLIEWRWGLSPLTARDASNDVYNLAYALDFGDQDNAVPMLPQPVAPLLGAPCLGSGGILGGATAPAPTPESNVWSELGRSAAANGFAVKLS